MYQILEATPVKPKDTAQRFRRALTVSYSEAVTDTAQLLDETLALVEQRFPQLDTAVARAAWPTRAPRTSNCLTWPELPPEIGVSCGRIAW